MNRIRATLAFLFCALAIGGCSQQSAHVAADHWYTLSGVVRLGEPDEPDNLNPMFGHTYATDQVAALLFSFILRYDDNGNLIPDLATAVPTTQNGGISKDGKTITVHLRGGTVWSDGEPLTARDWLFTYHAVLNPKNNVKTRYLWDDIAAASAPNDTTIVIKLKQPNASILGLLAMGGSAYPPLPAHILASLPDINTADFNTAPISSGPYILKEWKHGDSLIFYPNPSYATGRDKFRSVAQVQVIWKVIPDANTMFGELQSHEIDVYPSVNESSISRLGSIEGINVTKKLVANWRHLGFNLSRPMLSDVRVRQAITEGVDWKSINDTVYHGYNQLGVSDVYPASWAAPKLPPYRYDPKDAASLLAQAGWSKSADGFLHRNGQTLHLTISTGTNKMENQQSEVVIQSMLKKLGIDIEIKNYPVSLLFAQNGPIYSGKYDLEWSVETNGPDPDNSALWNGKYIPPNGANTSWLNDPTVNALSDSALRTYDRNARKAIYQREEERLRELYPEVAFYWENSYTAVNSDLKNYKPAAFIADTWNAYEWQI